jgi:hypothetical protein
MNAAQIYGLVGVYALLIPTAVPAAVSFAKLNAVGAGLFGHRLTSTRASSVALISSIAISVAAIICADIVISSASGTLISGAQFLIVAGLAVLVLEVAGLVGAVVDISRAGADLDAVTALLISVPVVGVVNFGMGLEWPWLIVAIIAFGLILHAVRSFLATRRLPYVA